MISQMTIVQLAARSSGYFCFFAILDKDECADENTNDCDPNALCTNTEGSYVCRCMKGYEGDGTRCTGMRLLKFYHQRSVMLKHQ